jgi:hypothetical protein
VVESGGDFGDLGAAASPRACHPEPWCKNKFEFVFVFVFGTTKKKLVPNI